MSQEIKAVYIVGFGNPEMVKVGVSKSPQQRIAIIKNALNIESRNVYIGELHPDPYFIEKRCHDELAEFCLGGFGPEKLYPKEIFKCSFNHAKEVSQKIYDRYKESPPEDGCDFWNGAERVKTYSSEHSRVKAIQEQCKILFGQNALRSVRKYKGKITTVELNIEFIEGL